MLSIPLESHADISKYCGDNTAVKFEMRVGVSHAVEVSSAFSAAGRGDLARVGGEAASERDAASSCASPDGSRDASALQSVSEPNCWLHLRR